MLLVKFFYFETLKPILLLSSLFSPSSFLPRVNQLWICVQINDKEEKKQELLNAFKNWDCFQPVGGIHCVEQYAEDYPRPGFHKNSEIFLSKPKWFLSFPSVKETECWLQG